MTDKVLLRLPTASERFREGDFTCRGERPSALRRERHKGRVLRGGRDGKVGGYPTQFCSAQQAQASNAKELID